MLEDACHELDLAAKFRDSGAGASYANYITALRQQSTLKESEERLAMQVRGMEQLVTSMSLALPAASSLPAYQQLCTELAKRRDRQKSVVITACSTNLPQYTSHTSTERGDREVGNHAEKAVQ